MLQMMCEHPSWDAADLSSLTLVQYGGSPVQERVARAWLDRGVRLVQGYGMTEASPGVYMGTHDGTPAHPTSVGVPHFFTDVALLRDDRPEPVGGRTGRAGWSAGRTCSPATGTVRRRPAAAFVDGGWFRTGDVLRVDDDGWAHVVDRVKDMYISGGENVYPAEVEAVAARLDAVANCAVVGVADARWGEVGAAYVQLRDGATLDRSRAARPPGSPPRPLQGAQVPGVRGRAAAQRHRQDPPGGAAAPGGGRASDRTGRGVAAGRNVMTTVAALPSSLQVERHGEVAVLRLARAAKRNALNDPTVLGIEAFFSHPAARASRPSCSTPRATTSARASTCPS